MVGVQSGGDRAHNKFRLDKAVSVRSHTVMMTYHLTLQDQINARPAQVSLVVSWREGVPMRLSDLIRERVSLEWDRRSDAANPGPRPLVEFSADRDATFPGATQEREHARQAGMSCDDAVTLALCGFGHNAFFVIVDDLQVTDLDTEIRLAPGTDVTFVRLVPLVGG